MCVSRGTYEAFTRLLQAFMEHLHAFSGHIRGTSGSFARHLQGIFGVVTGNAQ